MTLGVTNTPDHSALATALAGQPLELLILNVGVYLDRNDDLKTGFAPSLWTQNLCSECKGSISHRSVTLAEPYRSTKPEDYNHFFANRASYARFGW